MKTTTSQNHKPVYTLHQLPNGVGVIVQRADIIGEIIGGQAGFDPAAVDAGIEAHDTEGSAHLSDWLCLEITPEAAAYVFATYPAIIQES